MQVKFFVFLLQQWTYLLKACQTQLFPLLLHRFFAIKHLRRGSPLKKKNGTVWIVEFAFRMFPFITHFEEYKILQQTLLFAFLVGPCAFVVWRTRFFGPITSTRTGLIRDHFSYGFRRKFDAGP